MKRLEAVGDRRDVLVGVVATKRDLRIVREQRWYRIPVAKAPRGSWPPKWLAFYESKGIGGEEGAIRRFAEVTSIETLTREELFPGEPAGDKAGIKYHRLELGPERELQQPIRLTRHRSIAFISTTWNRLQTADNINDLYSDSPLEDSLWSELKLRKMPAERQWREKAGSRSYVLDFAIFCEKGKVDVETDGDTYHANSAAAVRDNQRSNALGILGWRLLRFSTSQIRDEMSHCLGEITGMVSRLGGFEQDGMAPRRWAGGADSVQLSFGEEPEVWDR